MYGQSILHRRKEKEVAAKGTRAKEIVTEKIGEIFTNSSNTQYIGVIDKKIYVNVLEDDTGETVQVSISLTCPKNPVGEITPIANNEDIIHFNSAAMPVGDGTTEDFEFTSEEMNNIDKVLSKLDLNF